MVDVSSQNNSVSINVSSSGNSASIKASPDTAQYYSEKSREYATSDKLIDGKDYSSKYYAQQSNANAQKVVQSENNVKKIYNSLLEESNSISNEIRGVGNEIVSSIEATKIEAENSINNTKTTIINDIEFVADGEKEEIKDLVDTGKDELKEAIGDVKVLTTLEIGDIGIAPLGIDESKGKRRYLNGQLIIQEQYVQFTNKVKSAVALYPSLACTESEWQTTATMTVGGQVGKFVVDDEAGTIRLPKIIMPIQGLTDLSKLGEIVEAGLPNITGHTEFLKYGTTQGQNGAITTSLHSQNKNSTSNGNYWPESNFDFDASKSNPIYSNSDTVQQEQIQYPYFIQVATGAETEDNIINEIELNNPYSLGDSKYSPVVLNNLSWLKSEGQYNSKAVYPAYYDWALTNFNNGVEGFALSTGEYTDYDVVINPADETFRLPLLDGSEDLPSNKKNSFTLKASESTYIAPANGWYQVVKTASSASQHLQMHNLTTNLWSNLTSENSTNVLRVNLYANRGDEVQINYTVTGTTWSSDFVYAQGNGSLYFYVGETVQNANLINAGRIQEKVAEAITRMDCKAYITETYINGTSWYRVWSPDSTGKRWCEQGGMVSVIANNADVIVTFLKPMLDTNYTVTIGQYVTSNTSAFYYNQGGVTKKTTQTVTLTNRRFTGTGSYTIDIMWQACGYIA